MSETAVLRQAGARRRDGEPFSKRLLDIGLSAAGLCVSFPAWALIATAIKLEDGGAVFFEQERVGLRGEVFRTWKFRSMKPRPEGEDPTRQAELEEERITRVGRLLRATALDELPQLWNILRGDMSIVGPRALVPEEVVGGGDGRPVRLRDQYGFHERHAVRPGLTGIAQLRAARDAPHREKFRYDLLYIRRRSLGLDLKLIFLSVWISVRGAWPSIGRDS